MAISETQKDLLSYLDYQTREFAPEKLERFTTIDIARAMSISRNLCSQYLNDLVRRGFVIKAGVRPIYYFHKHNLERYLQAKIEGQSYDAVEELMSLRGKRQGEGFERAIGYSESLSGVVSQMRRGIFYPPCGLPIMILGASGTGKTYMVELMLAYAKSAGILNEDAQLIPIDCANYQARPGEIIREFVGTPDRPGWREVAKGGILMFKNIDMLPAGEQEYLFTQALFAARAEQGSQFRGLRLVFTSSVTQDSEDGIRYLHRLPILVELPALHQRTDRERLELVLHFLRYEGRRMGVDVYVTTEVLNCLTKAQFDDNISELRRSITNACAEAYLSRKGDSRIEVRAFNLSTNVLQGVSVHDVEGDGKVIDITRLNIAEAHENEAQLFAGVVDPYRAFEEGKHGEDAFLEKVAYGMGHLEDRLSQALSHRTPRYDAFERLISEIVEEENATFSVSLSDMTSRMAAQMMYSQIRPGDSLPRWKQENQAVVLRMLDFMHERYPKATTIAQHLSGRIDATLDASLDKISCLFFVSHLALLEHIES